MPISRVERMKMIRRKKMRKYKMFLLYFLVAVLIPVSVSCSLPGLDKKTPEPAAASVSTQSDYYVVKKGTLSTELTGIGFLTPSRSTSLYFKDVSGPLSKIYVNFEDTIKKGALVAEILPTDMQMTIDQQKLDIQKDLIKVSQLKDNIVSIKNQIKAGIINLQRLIKDAKAAPEKNKAELDKAALLLEQLKAQLLASEKSKELAEIDVKTAKAQNKDLNIESLKLKLQQIKSDMDQTNYNITQAQASYDKAVKADKDKSTTDTANAVKQADLTLNQYKTDLNQLQNDKAITEAQLKLAQGDLGQADLDKANLSYQQVNDQITALNKSIDAAQITLSQTVKDNAKGLTVNQEDIQKAQIGLAQLNISLKTAQKDLLLAQLDQKSSNLLLQDTKKKLANCKLYSSAGGIITFVDSVTETDPISENKTIIKVTDPKNIVFQMTSADGRFLFNVGDAVMTIGQDKYTVNLYTPKPGDQLDTSTTDPANKNRFYLSFKWAKPKIDLMEQTQAALTVKKDNILVIPESCITINNGKTYVDLVKGNSTETVEIQRGISADGQVEVVSGLNIGDKIVQK